jgi:integrase
MGRLTIPGVCQIKGYTYRRFPFRDKDGKRKSAYVPLPDPTDPRFAAELIRVNVEHGDGKATRTGPIAGSFGALAADFRGALASGWTKKKRRAARAQGGARGLAANTLTNYARYIDLIESGALLFTNAKTGRQTPVRDLDVRGLRTAHVYQLRDAMAATPGKANNFLNVLKLMLAFAAQRDWRSDNPAANISPLPLGEHDPWPAAVQAQILERASPMLRLAIVSGLCSGQRISDVIKIQHGWLKGGILELAQIKTGVDIAIPVHPWWREEIAKVERKAVTVLYDRTGKPFRSEEAIQAQLRRLMRECGYVDADGQALFTYHGLRKNAACYLIEEVHGDDAVGRMLGMTAETVRHYTKRASAFRIATDVAAKVTAIPHTKMGR